VVLLAYIDQTENRRLVKHGYDRGALKRVLRERNRDQHADEIARCMPVSKDCRGGCPGRTIISGGREAADVGEAREVMDRVTDAILRGDWEALKGFTLRTRSLRRPTMGMITGRDQIAAYLAEFGTAFPDAAREERSQHEGGDTAIDEGSFVGTNTGSMMGPNHSRDRQKCAHSRVRRRDGREWGCHEPPFLLRRAGLGHAAWSCARVPGGASAGRSVSSGLARKPGNSEKEGKR